MINRVKEKMNNNFTIIPNEVFNGELSHKAIGIFAYLLSRPEDWKFNIPEIQKHFKIGRDAIRSALKELEDSKMLLRKQNKDEKGRFGKIDYILYPNEEDYENSNIGNTDVGKHDVGNSNVGNSNVGNSDPNNIEYNNTEFNNIEYTKSKSVRKSTHTKIVNEKTFSLMNQLNVNETFIEEIIKYRREIKAPFKTALGINNLLNEYLNIMKSLNINPYKIFEIQAGKEWKSVKIDWIQRELQNNNLQTTTSGNNMSEAERAIAMFNQMNN